MFLQQTFIALGRALPAVIAPAIITDLRIDASLIGVYFALTAASSLVAQLGCGSFIVRHGAMRMSQVSLVMVAAGTTGRLARLAHGSTTAALVRAGPAPVIAVPVATDGSPGR